MLNEIFENDDITDIVSEETVSMFEEKTNKKLPKRYVDLLKIQNGGQTKDLCFKTPEDISLRFDNSVPVFEMSGLGRKDGKYKTLERSDYLIKEWELPKEILLLFGEGHWWVFLDYRSSKSSSQEPKISLIDLEFDTDMVLAESFDQFIEGLEEEDDEDFDFRNLKIKY